MVSFIKNNKHFFSLLLSILLNSSLHSITFRNQPLSNFINEGEVLRIRVPENNFVILETGCDNFDLSQGDIKQLNNLEEIFQEVMAGRSGSSITSKKCDLLSNTINANSSYTAGQEYINIQAKTSAQFINCLFESPLISISSNKMNFAHSFLINPKVLNIGLNPSGSDSNIIQIIFYDKTEKPTVINGEIDLKNNQTTKKLILSNVKEIKMQFTSNKH
jgi:hypothetical protein